ncbi:phosphotriesterase [Fulvivirgaceae bacterium BMA12]|uniref:Phosphotriesterase n=1 Tax=Agaribacillus aureus TaxID=3051825 RepID=A0ABT8KYJ7_9BACT|nr:phosphotriesterase [Fulvivirgaceae bacterium BMA12]
MIRHLKKICFVGILLLTWPSCQTDQKNDVGFINTVNGRISVEKLKFALTHEHIMSNFGAEANYLPQYQRDSLFDQVLPYLKSIKALGVSTIFDCTTAYFGRDVNILKALADASGMQLITNTGFYGAANDRYVPEFAFKQNAAEISKRWIAEFDNGIDQTGIKPGFIKLAFDNGAPSEIDIKLFVAGILTHLSTGLTIAVHTGDNPLAAAKQLALLEEHQVSPEAWIWVHANKVKNEQLLIDAAKKGAWISLDGVKEANVAEYIRKIGYFKAQNLLHKVLLSHDGNSFPRGGKIRTYEAISKNLIPALKEQGYTDEEIDQLMVKNPQQAFAIKIRTSP